MSDWGVEGGRQGDGERKEGVNAMIRGEKGWNNRLITVVAHGTFEMFRYNNMC